MGDGDRGDGECRVQLTPWTVPGGISGQEETMYEILRDAEKFYCQSPDGQYDDIAAMACALAYAILNDEQSDIEFEIKNIRSYIELR